MNLVQMSRSLRAFLFIVRAAARETEALGKRGPDSGLVAGALPSAWQ